MQFIPKGPDIPDELLQFHEEGKVVFFCGAGVSMGAGLPDFKGLVQKTWKEVGNNQRTPEEKHLMRQGRYDAVLGFLESKFDNSLVMRNGLAQVLSRYKKKALFDCTHKSLLTLAQTRGKNPVLHLVTTNFDRLFENLKKESSRQYRSYIAPLLPVPRKTNWDGIVYLHGLLPNEHDENALRNLIVSSGDFGRAYLKERWAARFVSQLFREYVVCFVGYSLADPVMRYLADAIEADVTDGEDANPIYMFVSGDCSESLLRHRSIKCINYSAENKHELLHKTLDEWANTYSRGINGKESIVDACADLDPDKVLDNGYVGRMLWALSDSTGSAARRFAVHNPVPSLNWAGILASDEGWVPVAEKDGEICKKNKVQLLRLSELDNYLDVRQKYIWSWLLRHLTNPDLIWVVLREEDTIHPLFKRQLSYALTSLITDDHNRGNDNRKPSPDSKLHPVMYRLWRLIIAGNVISGKTTRWDFYDVHHRLQGEELNYSLLQDLRRWLTPAIYLDKSWGYKMHHANGINAPKDISSYFSWRLCLRHENGAGEYFWREIKKALANKLVEIFDCCEAALLDGLEALFYLDGAAEYSSAITHDILSIEDHTQNRNSICSWRHVVDLLRDAWLVLADKNRPKAYAAFVRWISSKHFLFQRLALFAAKRTDVVDPHEWYKALTANHGLLLWMTASRREVLRLLATTAKCLSKRDYESLAEAIAKGPPPCMFIGVKAVKRDGIIDRAIWLRLKKIECYEIPLPERAKNKLSELSLRNPDWELLRNQQEEFLVWSYGTGDPDFEAETQHILVPEETQAMVKWLVSDSDKPEHEFNTDDNWAQICREKPQLALDGLRALITIGKWNVKRINEALWAWREESLLKYGNEFTEQHIMDCPDAYFIELVNSLALWCEEAVKKKVISRASLVKVAKRIFSIAYEGDTPEKRDVCDDNPISVAINHPVGRIVEALLDDCFGKTIHKGEGIVNVHRELFSHVCDASSLSLRHGRVVLVSRMVGLYYADENWVREHIYPLLKWGGNHYEARAAWFGMLWVSNPHIPIMVEIKGDFLSTSAYISELGDVGECYCGLLTLMGLWHVPEYINCKEYKAIFQMLPSAALEHCAGMLRRYQSDWLAAKSDKDDKSSANDHIDERTSPERIWCKDTYPFIKKVWPKDAAKLSPKICRDFSQLVIGTGKEFPNALKSLEWILNKCATEDDWHLQLMKNGTRCLQDFPEESLEYLHKVARNIKWGVGLLKECLAEIIKVCPDLKMDGRYLQLVGLIRQRHNMI